MNELLPLTTKYLKTLSVSKLRRLRHHIANGRLVMMESCNCLLGFEGEYSLLCRKPVEQAVELELFKYPFEGCIEDSVTNVKRSAVLVPIIDRILATKTLTIGGNHARKNVRR